MGEGRGESSALRRKQRKGRWREPRLKRRKEEIGERRDMEEHVSMGGCRIEYVDLEKDPKKSEIEDGD